MLTFEVPLARVRLGGRVGFSESRQQPLTRQASPMARCLALGHRIVRAVEEGDSRDFSEVALRLGVSQPRVSMLVALTYLSPRIQEAILAGEAELGFRTLLMLARFDGWKAQEAQAKAAADAERDWGRTSRMINAVPANGAESRPKPSQGTSAQAQMEAHGVERQVKRTPRHRPGIPLSA